MKNHNEYYEKLAWFKENEKPEAILIIVDSPDSIKTVIAWTNMDTRPAGKLNKLNDKSENEIWTWLWDNTDYSGKEMIDKLGIALSATGLEARLKPLINNRVIYPDGTINSYVQKYLREQVVRLFKENKKSKNPS